MAKHEAVVNDGMRLRRQGQFGQVIHRLRKNKVAMLGLIVILAIILVAVLSPWISPYDYAKTSKTDRYATPSAEHWFGCDAMGRDIFSRILYGARASLPHWDRDPAPVPSAAFRFPWYALCGTSPGNISFSDGHSFFKLQCRVT